MASGESILVFFLQILKEELKGYKGLKNGEQRELELLGKDFGRLEAFLKDSVAVPDKTQLFRETVKQIREVAYEVEDAIEMCSTKNAAANTKSVFTRLRKWFSTSIAEQVKTLREVKVKPILDLIDKDFSNIDRSIPSTGRPFTEINLDQSIMQTPVTVLADNSTGQHSATTAQNEDQSNMLDKVVDFEDEATIMNNLMEPTDKLGVISIHGMAGLGKTTLGRKIFHEKTICRKFPLRIWIAVTQKFDSRDAFLKIMETLTPGGTSSPTDQELVTTLRRCLASKQFLLVMDDVWTMKDWEVIQKILPEENMESRVLVISRLSNIAKQVNIKREPHEMSTLGEGTSLELLKLRVFGDLKSCPTELEDIGLDIAKKCGGLPLTIVLIAGILQYQYTKTRAPIGVQKNWSTTYESMNKILEDDEDKLISNVLEMSYITLSGDMRLCFLYTGLFPEKYEIPASTLIQLWIAEGFIRPRQGSFEEVAEKILEDLINKSLLIVTKKNLDQVKTCRVHDIIREFCKAKARDENLFRVIKESNEGVHDPPLSELQTFRRLCLHSDLSKFLSGKPNGPLVRSFICFLEKPCNLDPMQISTIPFDVLRVLNCKSIRFGEFPKVTGLILLKHITLSIDKLDVLPEQVSQLVNLRTLIVITNSLSITVKANIWKMKQLTRFKTKAAIILDEKNWTGKACENLHTLSRVSPKSCKPALSKRAPKLKTLGIQGKVANLLDTFSLQDFQFLKKLKLVNELAPSPLALTRPDCFPLTLESLTLSSTNLKWNDHKSALANISSLKVLKLKDNAFEGIHWDVDINFAELQFLLIETTNVVTWTASATHFPKLRWLVIKSCGQLQEIPVGLATNLEKLEIENIKQSVVESAKAIESNKSLAVQNQPSISRVPFTLTIGTIWF